MRNGSFEDFVSDGRKDSLVVAAVIRTNTIESESSEREERCKVGGDALETKVLVNLGQDGDIRPGHDSKSQRDHLHVCSSQQESGRSATKATYERPVNRTKAYLSIQ